MCTCLPIQNDFLHTKTNDFLHTFVLFDWVCKTFLLPWRFNQQSEHGLKCVILHMFPVHLYIHHRCSMCQSFQSARNLSNQQSERIEANRKEKATVNHHHMHLFILFNRDFSSPFFFSFTSFRKKHVNFAIRSWNEVWNNSFIITSNQEWRKKKKYLLIRTYFERFKRRKITWEK